MLLLSIVLLDKPSYPTYSVQIVYNIPWMNNTQRAQAVYDQASARQVYNFYNRSQLTADSTYIFNGTYQGDPVVYTKYARTEKNSYGCVYQFFRHEVPFVTFLPNLDQYDEMDQTMLRGEQVRHFRQSGTYTTQDTDGEYIDYTEARTYERNFYCKDKSGTCIPVRWELYSKSNFQSHFDIYVLEYYNFTQNVSESDFTLYDFHGKAKCPEDPSDGEDPSGPKRGAFPFAFLLQHTDLQSNKGLEKLQNTLNALKTIKKINENEGFTFKAVQNHLVGLKREEILRFKGGKNKKAFYKSKDDPDIPTYNYTYLYEPLDEDLPESLDWRMVGIGHVKDQLFCGSCWTFSAIGCMESRVNIWYRNNQPDHDMVTLSEQSVIDCFWKNSTNGSQTSSGCEGGDENDVLMTWGQEGKHLFALDTDYPYLGQDDYCKPDLETFDEFKVKRAHLVPPGSVTQLKRALLTGPVSVGISVPESLLYYGGGVYNDASCGSQASDIDHAVLAVGWGVDEVHGEYWIIRNSWSPAWGDNGYIYITTKGNLCGVTTMPAYVELEKVTLDNAYEQVIE